MMKRMTSCLMLMALVGLACAAHAKKQTFRVPGGATISPLGISIDASYDSRLDDFVSGYKVVNVAMVNQGFNMIYLNPEKDRWKIKLASRSKPIDAIHDLRRVDPEAWHQIPEEARGLVSYPLVLPIGARQVIDIFVPDTVDVTAFNELDVYLQSLNTKFQILVRQ